MPLTSLKPNKKIPNTSVFLGRDLVKNIANKARRLLDSINKEQSFSGYNKLIKSGGRDYNIINQITNEEIEAMKDYKEKTDIIEKILSEAEQMKKGSIALVNQITTISKQRIYNPKNDFDVLAGIKVSSNYLDLIDEKIKELFLKKE